MANLEYRIFALPKLQPGGEQDWPSRYLAEKFQEFRLHALRTSPEAFASTPNSPRELDLQFTIQRLSNPKAVHYIAAEGEILQIDVLSPEVFKDILRYIEWMGLIVLLGPEEHATAEPPSARTDPFAQMTAHTGSSGGISASALVAATATEQPSLHYHLNGMFVTPTARSRGVGKALIQKALAAGLAQARNQGCSARFSIAVNEENASAKALYEKVGFRHAGKETYTQQRRTADGTATVERVALHMEMICI